MQSDTRPTVFQVTDNFGNHITFDVEEAIDLLQWLYERRDVLMHEALDIDKRDELARLRQEKVNRRDPER